jgi:hypothetical protein
MNKEDLKKELHQLIDNTDDEKILNLVKEDIVAYQARVNKDFDDLSDLSPEDRAELEELATEDTDKDTVTEEEFIQHIQEWRNRLSTKRDL